MTLTPCRSAWDDILPSIWLITFSRDAIALSSIFRSWRRSSRASLSFLVFIAIYLARAYYCKHVILPGRHAVRCRTISQRACPSRHLDPSPWLDGYLDGAVPPDSENNPI